MNTATAAAVGTSPEVLQHYLTAGIEVKWRLDDSQEYKLTALLTDSNTCYLNARYTACLEDIKPVLRDFSQLTVPLPTGEVPAVEVAKLAYPNKAWRLTGGRQLKTVVRLFIENKACDTRCNIYDSWDIRLVAGIWDEIGPVQNQAKIFDYLRSRHFAVGLEPHQYIPLTAPSTPTREADNTATTIL